MEYDEAVLECFIFKGSAFEFICIYIDMFFIRFYNEPLGSLNQR